jgi:hypothetical protein
MIYLEMVALTRPALSGGVKGYKARCAQSFRGHNNSGGQDIKMDIGINFIKEVSIHFVGLKGLEK